MQKTVTYFLFILLGILFLRAEGQETGIDVDPSLITLKAQLVSRGDSMGIPFAKVVYTRNRTGTTTNAGGYFSIEMLNIDSLTVSAMGFETQTVKIPRNYSENTTLKIYMRPVVYMIREVQVSGDKNKVDLNGVPTGKPTNIPNELRGDAFNKKPPVIAAFLNPLSYWQYYLSHKEIQKRKVREAVSLEKNWEMHAQNYNKRMVMMLTGLNDQQAEEFMIWFNSKDVLPYVSTEYEVRAAIRRWFQEYKREKGFL